MSYDSAGDGTAADTFDDLREKALAHVWFPAQQWTDLAEGGLRIIAEGQGVKVKDFQGNWYYDASAGQQLVNVGHGRREIPEAVRDQLATLHYAATWLYSTVPVIRLAEKVASLTPGDLNRSFFTSGGSESVETALKMALNYFANLGESQRTKCIARKGSYHGMSLGALSVNTAPSTGREVFGQILQNNVSFAPQPSLYHCEFGSTTQSECATRSAQAIEEIIQREGPETVAAVIGEPVSISAGVAVPGDEYWPMVRQICDKYGVLLIADEVITGFGRTGKWFGSEHWDVVPDIMAVAKGITSGYVPMGACIARDHIYEAFKGGPEATFNHGYSYSGHPGAAAAAMANIDILEREHLVENSATVGKYMLDRLTGLKEHPTVGDVRGLGICCAVELVKDKRTKESIASVQGAGQLVRSKMAELGMLGRVGRDFLLLTPPLTVTEAEVDEMVDIIDRSIGHMEKESALG